MILCAYCILRKSWRVNCRETWPGDPCLNPRKNCASVLGARHTARARRTASTCTTLMTIAGDRSIGRFYGTIHGDVRGNTDLRWKTATPPLFHPSVATLPEDEPRGLLRSVRTLRRPPHLTHLTPTSQQQSRTHARRPRARRRPLKQQPPPGAWTVLAPLCPRASLSVK